MSPVWPPRWNDLFLVSQTLLTSQQHGMGMVFCWISSQCICRIDERVKNIEDWERGSQKPWDNDMWKPTEFGNLTSLDTHDTNLSCPSTKQAWLGHHGWGRTRKAWSTPKGKKKSRTHGFAHLQRLGWKCKNLSKLSSRRNTPGHHNKQQEIQVQIHSGIVLPDSSDKAGVGRVAVDRRRQRAPGEGGAGRMRLKCPWLVKGKRKTKRRYDKPVMPAEETLRTCSTHCNQCWGLMVSARIAILWAMRSNAAWFERISVLRSPVSTSYEPCWSFYNVWDVHSFSHVDLPGSNKDRNHIPAFPQWGHLYCLPLSLSLPPSRNMLELKYFGDCCLLTGNWWRGSKIARGKADSPSDRYILPPTRFKSVCTNFAFLGCNKSLPPSSNPGSKEKLQPSVFLSSGVTLLIFSLCNILFLLKKGLEPAMLFHFLCFLLCLLQGGGGDFYERKIDINDWKLWMVWIGDALDACNLCCDS